MCPALSWSKTTEPRPEKCPGPHPPVQSPLILVPECLLFQSFLLIILVFLYGFTTYVYIPQTIYWLVSPDFGIYIIRIPTVL